MSTLILSFLQITSKSDEGSQRTEQGRLTVSETFASTSVGPKFKIWYENGISNPFLEEIEDTKRHFGINWPLEY